jgi:hypothetical protein
MSASPLIATVKADIALQDACPPIGKAMSAISSAFRGKRTSQLHRKMSAYDPKRTQSGACTHAAYLFRDGRTFFSYSLTCAKHRKTRGTKNHDL